MKRLIIIKNIETNEYYFSTDRYQQLNSKCKMDEKFKNDNWVPITFYLPLIVKSRPLYFVDFTINNISEFRTFEKLNGYIEIENPDEQFKIKENKNFVEGRM
jgi:hypothetical protein